MSKISIEGTPVAGVSGGSSGGSGVSISGHLLLIFTDSSGQEFVVRGGPTNGSDPYGPLILEQGVPIDISIDRRVDSVGAPVTAASRGNREVQIDDREAEDVWNLVLQHAGNIHNQSLTYKPTGFNSNGTVGNLLYLIGVDVDSTLPDPDGIMLFPFFGRNVDFAFDYNINGTASNDIIQGRGGMQTFTGGGGDDTLRGGANNDIAVFRGDCLDYNIVRNSDNSITVNHARGSMDDGVDMLFDMEKARFADGKELDLTLSEIHGCTELGFLRDFVTGTTQDRQVVFDMKRKGDTSYPIEVFVDGRVTTGNAIFNDFYYTLPAGENPQLIIGASVAEVFGDVAFDFEIDVSIVSPLKQLVEFSDATAGGVLIGDRVDRRGGRWWGDPHLITFDNVSFDFQAEGEFVLAKAISGSPYEVQARFKAISSAVSVADAVATKIGSDVVTIEIDGNDGELRINGVETLINNGTQINVGNGSISRNGRIFLINYGNGDQTEVNVFATFLNASPIPAQTRAPGSFVGLLGNNNGTPADDFRLANGTVLLTPIPIDTLYGAFAQSWTVAASERILPGVVTAYDAPDRIITVDSLPASLRARAEAVVNAYGITNELVREAAILDYALTGNNDFIEAAVLTDKSFDPIVETIPVDPVANPVVIITSDLISLVEENPQANKAKITISRGSSIGDLTVNYAIIGFGPAPATAPDFMNGAVNGSVLIKDGSDSATFEIEIIDDSLAEDIEEFDLVISLDPAQANKYEVLVSSLRLSIDDADSAAGITISPTTDLTTTEAGGTASFSVFLNSKPSADVIIGLSSSDTTEGTLSISSLTFTTANWNMPQTVTVTGADDPIIDGNIDYSILTDPAVSIDANYNGFKAPDISLTNIDNDHRRGTRPKVPLGGPTPPPLPSNPILNRPIFSEERPNSMAFVASGFSSIAESVFSGIDSSLGLQPI